MTIEIQSSKLIKPSIPTPQTLRHYKIGFTDEVAPAMNLRLLFSYPATGNPKSLEFIARLETSLEKTLTQFYPLAGRYVKEMGAVDSNDQGAEFIRAKADITLQDVLGYDVDFKLVDEFIPSETGAADLVTDPILSIQVTMFECGGLAIGVNISHRIVDASTFATFLNAWATINREKIDSEFELFTAYRFNSSSIFPSRGWRSLEIGIPRSISIDLLSKYATKKLSFSGCLISKIKAKAMLNGYNGAHKWSKVQLVQSIIWKAFIDRDRAKHDHPRKSILIQPINLREKTASKIPKHACGNICGVFATDSRSSDTSEELADLLRDSVKKTINEYLKVHHDTPEGQTMIVDSFSHITNFPDSAHVAIISSWCKFSFYEVDFGFGKPSSVTSGSLIVKDNAFLIDDAEGNGVEAFVCLGIEDVLYFEKAMDISLLGI